MVTIQVSETSKGLTIAYQDKNEVPFARFIPKLQRPVWQEYDPTLVGRAVLAIVRMTERPVSDAAAEWLAHAPARRAAAKSEENALIARFAAEACQRIEARKRKVGQR